MSGSEVKVKLAEKRFHLVRVADCPAHYDLAGTIAHPSRLRTLDKPALEAWKRNRSVQLVAFCIDRRGSLLATAWVPKAGLGSAEFLARLRLVAAEADRWEFALTGTDEH